MGKSFFKPRYYAVWFAVSAIVLGFAIILHRIVLLGLIASINFLICLIAGTIPAKKKLK